MLKEWSVEYAIFIELLPVGFSILAPRRPHRRRVQRAHPC